MADAPRDPVAVALIVAAAFEALGVPYVIGGSLASSVHGEPRATNDVDVVAALDARSGASLADRLAGDWYVSREAVAEAVSRAASFNAIHLASAVKVDVFVAGNDAFEAERLRRRIAVPLGDGALYVDTAEHTILRKLEWYLRGGETSERQWRDVMGILRLQQGRLDERRLAHWARHLGVTRLLRRAMREASSGSSDGSNGR